MSQSFLQRSSFDSWPIAKPLQRCLAFLIDCFAVLVIVVIAMKLFKQPIHWQNTPFFWMIAMWFWEAFFGIFTGSSPGKKLLALEIYSPRYDGAPSPVQVSLRIIMFWIGLLLLGVGVLPILSRRDHRGWHDLIAETLVVGTSRSNPSPMAMKWIPEIVLILSLVLFSGIGARIFSVGLKNSQVYTYSLKNCDSPNDLVKNTNSILLGLVLSPAFTNCWQAIETTNQNISDSKIYKLANISRKYHHYLMIPTSARAAFYQNEIQPLEKELCRETSRECNSAGFLASLHSGENISFADHYFSENADLLKTFFTTGSPLDTLKQNMDNVSGWTATLLKELWIGLDPSQITKLNVVSNNADWIQAVDCLQRRHANTTSANCNTLDTAYYAVEAAESGNLEPMEQYLATQPRDFVYEELKALRAYYAAKMSQDNSATNAFLQTYPQDALFHQILAKGK